MFTRLNSSLPSFNVTVGLLLAAVMDSGAQDIEPRRWSHIPIGANFLGGGYAYTSGDIYLNPVLKIEDGEFDLQSVAFRYIHSFEMLGKSARFDVIQPYQSGTWSGLVNGVPTSVDRDGWSDTSLRFAVNLIGAPPLAGKEFAEYNKDTQCETIVGVGLLLQLPTGEYMNDKLINLGTNRYTITPQAGVVHNRGKWSTELSGSVSFFTDNHDYFNGKTHEEDPYPVIQGHLSYTFLPGLWLSAGVGYGFGGESTIDRVSADDFKGNLGWGVSMGIPVNRAMGFKIAYIGTQTDQDTGSDTDTLSIGFSVMW